MKDYLTPPEKINKISEKELLKCLEELDQKHKELRRSFKFDRVSLSKQVGR